MTRILKQHPILITSAKGKTVRALVSVFGNVDYAGDRVMPGAFTNSIAEWEASGDKLPFIWAHSWNDPMAHLGVVTSMKETDRGLEVEAEILDDNPFATQVQKLLDQRRVVQFSFAYDTIRERKAEDGANELVELRLIECGPALSGMNPETELMSRKSVQEMLARESNEPTWAGTTIPRKAVDDLRNGVSGVAERFLDGLYDAAPKATDVAQPLDPDAELKAQLDALSPVKAAAPRGVDLGPVATVLLHAASLFEQNAVRSLSAGLVDEAQILMESARGLRAIVAGGEGDVQAIIDAVTPVVAALRTNGQPQAGDNLERAIAELAGGATGAVTNEDRIEGSVNVDASKQRADREKDAALRAKMEETWPTPNPEPAPRGHWAMLGMTDTWINDPEEGAA